MNVSLWDMSGVGVILKSPTRIKYENQTGGTTCFQSSEEGVFVPVNQDLGTDMPSLETELADLLQDVNGLSPTQAEVIDSLMSRNYVTKDIQVDRNHLDESHEAWVYVKIDVAGDSTISSLQCESGVMTWPNSD